MQTQTSKPHAVDELLDRFALLYAQRPKPGKPSEKFEEELGELAVQAIRVGLKRVDDAVTALERIATSLEAKGDVILTFSDLTRKVESLTDRISGFRGR